MLRTILFACVLWLMPACVSVPGEQPMASAQSLEARAETMLVTYAAMLDAASALTPSAPASVRQALARAERVATPASETLARALSAHLRIRSDATEFALIEAMQRAEDAFAIFADAMP